MFNCGPAIFCPIYDAAAVSDPYFSFVTLLMHCETNTDDSPLHNTMTQHGAAAYDATHFKYGANALDVHFNNTADYMGAATPAMQLGSSDFCVEAWVYCTAYPAVNAGIISAYPTTSRSTEFLLNASGTPFWRGSSDGVNDNGIFPSASSVVPLNTWTHIAAVRNTGVVIVYLNGIGGTPTADARTYFANILDVSVGVNKDQSWAFSGWIDEVRVTKGVPRYTANFTPPTAAYPNF